MGQRMKLIDIIRDLNKYDDELTIYAKKPWHINSLAIVGLEPGDEDKPKLAIDQNLDYFLEVFVANEFIHGWLSNIREKPSDEEICQRLIDYAINDA